MPDGTEDTQQTQETQQTLETLTAQRVEEKTASATLKEAMAEKDARIAELEGSLTQQTQATQQTQSELDASITELAKAKETSEAAIGIATGKYREALVAGHPDIPQELIAGNTVEELFTSVEKGKAVVESVKKALDEQAAAGKVPAGAPTRGGISTEGMSAKEKIVAGILPKGQNG